MPATYLLLWLAGFLAATFVPPFWVPPGKRRPLREMLSSAWFGISVAILAIGYTMHAVIVGEITSGKHHGHVYYLANDPWLFFIILVLNLLLFSCGLVFCWNVFAKNRALYVGR